MTDSWPTEQVLAASLKARQRDRIPAEPLRLLVREQGIGATHVAERLRGRSRRNLQAWQQWFRRLEQNDTISFPAADEVCVAIGAHLSWVDETYRMFDDESPERGPAHPRLNPPDQVPAGPLSSIAKAG